MCGFAGFMAVEARGQAFRLPAHPTIIDGSDANYTGGMAAVAANMALAIKHRGPDDGDSWADEQAGIAFGHRRLSIVDLTAAGHQPMHSASGRYVIAFNGEVYNHLDIRAELDARMGGSASTVTTSGWRGHSDTETLLAGFEAWGVEATLKKMVGMFAIALWDTHRRALILVRDRFGEKPLYYGWAGSSGHVAFVFGSELKALRAYPGFVNPVSREALALYMRYCYVPAPHSIYQDVFKLEPGCMLTLSCPAEGACNVPPAPSAPMRPPESYGSTQGTIVLHRWWALTDVVASGARSIITNETEALQELESRLQASVQLQSMADVPLGAFLSGGIDSSTIVALMQKQAMRPVKTFTVGFEEAGFNEAPHARAVAQHLGTDHAELFVTAHQAQEVVPQLPQMYDEPFADSSQIPTHLVCKAARQHVTVALSGDAGDELFGGYNRYFWAPRIWQKIAWLPYSARQGIAVALGHAPENALNHLGKYMRVVRPAEKLQKLSKALSGAHNIDELYENLVSEWHDPAMVVRGYKEMTDKAGYEPSALLSDTLPSRGTERAQLRMMFKDCVTYLPDDILCKVDRAAMAASLETRVPFLDHRVAELAWRLPLSMKMRGNEGKWALRQVLYKYVPRELIDRPKAGFSIPVGQWLRGPLRDWAESLLEEKRLQEEGYFHPAPIRAKWDEHIRGKRDHTASLWAVLMFQAWLEDTRAAAQSFRAT